MRENRLRAIIRECIEDLINEGREDANIRQATPNDYRDILRMTVKIMPYPVSLLDNFIREQGGINYDISVVAEDNEGKLVGMSTCTNGRIEDAYPGVMHSERELMEALSNKNYVMGFGLFMEKEYRGRLPRKLMSAMVSNAKSTGADFLVEFQLDFAFSAEEYYYYCNNSYNRAYRTHYNSCRFKAKPRDKCYRTPDNSKTPDDDRQAE